MHQLFSVDNPYQIYSSIGNYHFLFIATAGVHVLNTSSLLRLLALSRLIDEGAVVRVKFCLCQFVPTGS